MLQFGRRVAVSSLVGLLGLLLGAQVIAAPPLTAASRSRAAIVPGLSINAGGPASGVTTARGWSADRGWKGGRRATIDGPVSGTTQDVLYRTARVGVRGYSLRLPASGTYRLSLLFAEPRRSRSTARVFSVAAEGRTLVRDLDVAERVGTRAALRLTRTVVSRGRRLDLRFSSTRGSAMISGIRARRVAPGNAPSARSVASVSSGRVGNGLASTRAVMMSRPTASLRGSRTVLRYRVLTGKPTRFRYLMVALRRPGGADVGADTGVLVNTSVRGRRHFTAFQTLDSGTWIAATAYSVTGSKWVVGPSRKFTVKPDKPRGPGRTKPPSDPGGPGPTSAHRPFLVEHGWDVSTASEIAARRSQVDSLPFDGVSVRPQVEPLGRSTVSSAAAAQDLAALPAMTNVTHNFLLMRMLDNAPAGAPHAYDFYDDALWARIAQNAASYAAAARAASGFDGIMIDTEYYGVGPNPWNFGASTAPWTYSETAGATPGRSAAQAQAKVQARGRQVMDAIRAAWPGAKVMFFRAAWLSEPASFTPDRFDGNNVAWANELNGPFVVGFVSSAQGSQAQIIDGTELYTQRSLADFRNVYSWAKTGLPDHGGRIVPAGDVTAAGYKSHISVAQVVYDRDVLNSYATLSPAVLGDLVAMSLRTSDTYTWMYTESFDWRSTGWPATRVTPAYVDAVAAARSSWTAP